MVRIINPFWKHFPILVVYTVFCFISAPAVAQVGTAVASGQTVTIDAHGECRQVTNPSTGTRMVFTNTAAEWKSFRDNTNGLTMEACALGGYYWRSTRSADDLEWCPKTTLGSEPCAVATANYPSGSAGIWGMDHQPECKAWMDITLTVSGGSGHINQEKPSGWFCNANPKVLCGYFNSIGLLPDNIYAADVRYAQLFVPASVNRGYRLWAEPITAYLERHPESILVSILQPFVVGWAEEMAYRMGDAEKPNWVGRVLISVGTPFSKGVAWVYDTYLSYKEYYLSISK